VRQHLPLAHRIARRYAGRGIATDDMQQVAAEGLVKAARHFDPARGTTFASYAVPSITGELRRHFRDHGWWVRPPRQLQELRPEIAAAEADLRQSMGRAPTDAEIAEYAEADLALVRECRELATCFSPRSIDVESGPSGVPLASLMGGDDPEMESVENRLALSRAVDTLEPRDRSIIRMRFAEEMTQAEIGKRIGVTQMQVSRLLTRILRDLRELLTEPVWN